MVYEAFSFATSPPWPLVDAGDSDTVALLPS